MTTSIYPTCSPGYEPLARAIKRLLGADPDKKIPPHLRVEYLELSAKAKRAMTQSWPVDYHEVQHFHEKVYCVDSEQFRAWAREVLHQRAKRDEAFFEWSSQQNPASAIAEFLSYFGQGEPGVYKQYRNPPAWVMEYVAARFRAWYENGGSLDDAFMVKASGRGKRTPREELNQPYKDFEIQHLYAAYLEEEQQREGSRLRGDLAPWQRAIDRVAGELGLQSAYVEKRLKELKQKMKQLDEDQPEV